MHKRKKGRCTVSQICACLLAMMVMFVQAAALSEVQNTVSSGDDSPGEAFVRVYLASLGAPRTLDLQLSAAYHVADSDIALPAGAQVALTINPANGGIRLSCAGQNWEVGSETTLLRNADGAALQIQQALGAGAYPADLRIRSVEKNNSYSLEVIAFIRVEDYLPGVLSYAIISTAPAEALKAQAVVSRTYTLLAMQNNAENRYDLVDTGADQIYRGSPEENAACENAVRETEGCVLTYNGSLAKPYYCLSNGGQTEAAANAWNENEYPYLIVQDDPYDIASATAFARTTALDKDLVNGNTPDALKTLLKEKALTALKENGIIASAETTSLLTLKNITLHTPKYAEPSRLYTKADFDLVVETNVGSGERQEHPLVVTADIFDELETLLEMSLQSNTNELWSAEVQESSVQLRAGRYGHGVGMSQCGAMEMAKQGSDCDTILAFYYPGCRNTSYDSGDKPLSEEVLQTSPSAYAPTETPLPESTPAPSAEAVRPNTTDQPTTTAAVAEAAATAPPAQTAGLAQIYYTYVTAKDFVNLREKPNVHTDILTVALHGEMLRVLDVVDGWALVEYNGVQAYAVCNLLSLPFAANGQAAQTTPAPTAISTATPAPATETNGFSVAAKVYAKSGTVNFRENPSKTAGVIMRLLPGTVVEVTGIGGDFCSVVYLGIPGYIMTEFLRFDQEAPVQDAQATAAPIVQPVPAQQETANDTAQQTSPCSQPQQTEYRNARVTTNGGTLNLRVSPNGSARVIARIPQCAVVQAVEYDDIWCAVRYDGMDGYAKSAFLTFGDNYAAETITDRMTIALPEYSIGPAVITTPSGSLNLRQAPCPYGTVLALIPQGSTVEVYALKDGWALVAYKEYIGYVSETYLTMQHNANQTAGVSSAFGAPQSTAVPSAAADHPDQLIPDGYEAVEGTTAAVKSTYTKLHLNPDLSARVLDVMEEGTELPVLAVGAEWCMVAWQNQVGYVLQSDVAFHLQ